jgi:hypothetical protein
MLMNQFEFHYHGTDRQKRRLQRGEDHCRERDVLVYDLKDIVQGGYVTVSGKQLTTPAPREEGCYIYAVRDGEIRVAVDGLRGTPGSVKHETLFQNLPVNIAGEIQFQDGVVVNVTDQSGSYACTAAFEIYPEAREAVIDALRRSGAQISDEVAGQLSD